MENSTAEMPDRVSSGEYVDNDETAGPGILEDSRSLAGSCTPQSDMRQIDNSIFNTIGKIVNRTAKVRRKKKFGNIILNI